MTEKQNAKNKDDENVISMKMPLRNHISVLEQNLQSLKDDFEPLRKSKQNMMLDIVETS